MSNNKPILKNLHLSLSALTIIIVGFIYGFNPTKIIPIFFDFKVTSIDLNNIFRATMTLYFGIAIYWLIGVIKPTHWKNATLINILFMGSLAFGRLLSFALDGISIPFTKGLILELFFMFWGIYNLKKYK